MNHAHVREVDMSSGTFEYREKKLGDTEGIIVETRADVFQPTSTTNLLLSGVRKFVNSDAATALDLGCGCGIVAVVLAKLILPDAAVCASDIDANAVSLTEHNSRNAGLDIDSRCGSMFEPWADNRFDVIVDDVAGMSEPIARHSSWYPPQIHSDAGEDGARWIVNILSEAADHLTPEGQLFFPVLTLSDEEKILNTAQTHFAEVKQIAEQWYPFDNDLLLHFDLIEDLAAKGVIEVKKRGSRWLWATKIYLATNKT